MEPSSTDRGTVSPVARLRRYFLTGIIVAGPLTITGALTWWFVTSVDRWVKPLVPTAWLPETYLEVTIPGFGLLVAIAGLTLLGFLAANLAGRALLGAGERVLERMPVIRGVYKGTKQVFATVLSSGGSTFRTVGLVQFPSAGMWSVVFLSESPGEAIAQRLPGADPHIGVFLPCAPNPTTGFFFYVPRSEIIDLAISVEDAAKLVMSAGLIHPEEHQQRLAALAAARPQDPA